MSKQPTAEETINALVVESRVLEGTFNELTARQNLLERGLLESRAALDAIKGLSDNPGSEVLTQIGGGAMLRSPPPATDIVLVSVGAGVVLEKPKEEAIAILEERARDLEKTIVSVLGQRNEIAQRLNSDREALNSLLSQQNQDQEE
jgi:prefoldin alpha subunit